MNAEMIAALRELEREKGSPFETILQGLEEAMASAYKAHWQEHPDADDEFVGFRASIDPETGDLRMWQQELEEVDLPPVEGDEPAVEMNVISEAEVEVTDDFKGRIGAQTAKQVIFQKLRDAEREMTYEEFAGREGDVVTGIVQQQERRYTLLDLARSRRCSRRASRCRRSRCATANASRRSSPRSGVGRRAADRGLPHASRAPQGAVRDGGAEIDEGIVEMWPSREPGHRSRSPSRRTSLRSTPSEHAWGPGSACGWS